MASHLPLVRLPPNATIHRFGTPRSASRLAALLRFPRQGWTIEKISSQPQGWAIVGDAEGRRLAVETLLSRHRIHPSTPPPGPFPYISSVLSKPSTLSEHISRPVRHLAFARPPSTGEFTDFTARYGALQQQDKLSFRQTLSALYPPPSSKDIERVSRMMRIDHLLGLPGVSLSSGQTRRGRIAAALLTRPVLLLLEDPMAGLDISSRKQVSQVLVQLNETLDIKVILVLRSKAADDMPDWITDVCDVREGNVWIGSQVEWKEKYCAQDDRHIEAEHVVLEDCKTDFGQEPVVRLHDVSVSYGEGSRPVLRQISWAVRLGERWHLQGANGSGKTTLLSLILGHHPRSFSLPAEALRLFSRPRRQTPTPILRTLIGHTSPEIFASFPRGMGLTAREAVGSGFEGVFSRRQLSIEQKNRVSYLLDWFQPLLATTGQASKSTEKIAKRPFAHFTPPQQALFLFLRAIVARPPLLILDEPSQGIDEVIWARCRELLEKEWAEKPEQAVIVVSHYNDEVPWRRGRGHVIRLVDGKATFE